MIYEGIIMNACLLGDWESGDEMINHLTLGEGACTIDGIHGRWSATDDEIWLLDGGGTTGTKWHFTLENDDVVRFHDPENFTYLGHGEYIYFQMLPPTTTITFRRIA
jgi:hypothetical protein